MGVEAGTSEIKDLLAESLAALKGDYQKLGVRLRVLEHEVPCACSRVSIRVHYPALRDGQATVHDLVRLMMKYLLHFALPRKRVSELKKLHGSKIKFDDLREHINDAEREAKSLFIKAQKATNRNGEGGELLLYLLTEWILEAPQVLAKLPLKTNTNVAVHGSDGVHVKYSPETKNLMFFWGESKLHADVSAGISSAAKSLSEALKPAKLEHEFNLISRNLEFSGLSDEARAALLSYLDPNDENSNARTNVTTCLIGFDFDAYTKLRKIEVGGVEDHFRSEVLKTLPEISMKISESASKYGISEERMEIFVLPLPSVQEFRDFFQSEVGWSP